MIGKDLVDKLYNDELREDTVFGAFPCELTGRQLPDDKMYIEVKLPSGETVFARMCFSFPLVAMPSKEWIDAYKDSIYGWLTFEQGLPEKPVLIGFTFQEGKEHNVDSFPDSATLIGSKYQITIDDKEDRLELKQLTGNQQEIVITTDSVYIKSENINLGEETAQLGGLIKIEELITNLDKLTARVDGIIDAINNGVPIATDGGIGFQTTMKVALALLIDKEDFTQMENENVKHS